MAQIYTMPLRVRVSPEEYAAVCKMARLHHESVSAYIRKILTGGKLTSYLDEDAMDALHQAAITLLASDASQRENAQYLLSVSRRIDAFLEEHQNGKAQAPEKGGAA